MISHIKVKNFKRIDEVDIQLGAINLITGPNNNGKTSFLQAIMIAYDALNKIAEVDANGNVKFSFTSQGGNGKLLFYNDLSFYMYNAYEVIKDKNMSRAVEFEIDFFNGFNFAFHIDDVPHYIRVVVSKSDELKSGVHNSRISDILKSPPLYIPSFTGIDSHEKYMFLGQMKSLITRGHASHTLKNLLYRLSNQPDKMSIVTKFLQLHFAESFKGFIVESDPEKHENIIIKYRMGRSGYELSTIGSGFLQLTGILALAVFFDSSNMLLLDEPDAHLHSSLQSTLMSLLRGLRDGHYTPPKQIIVATHSLDLINNTEPKHIFYVQQGKCLSNSNKQRDIEILLEDLGAGNFEFIKARNYSRLLFTEDKSDYDRLLLWSKQLGQMWDDRFGNFFIQGSDWRRINLSFLRQLIGHGMKSLIILDRDAKPDMVRSNELKSLSTKFTHSIIWSRSMIESYFLSPEAYYRYLSQKVTYISIDEVLSSFEDAMSELKQKAVVDVNDRMTGLEARGLYLDSFGSPLHKNSILEKAMEYVEDKWKSFEGKLEVVHGKELQARVNKAFQDRHKISISDAGLLRCFTPEIIHPDIKLCIKIIGQFATTK